MAERPVTPHEEAAWFSAYGAVFVKHPHATDRASEAAEEATRAVQALRRARRIPKQQGEARAIRDYMLSLVDEVRR